MTNRSACACWLCQAMGEEGDEPLHERVSRLARSLWRRTFRPRGPWWHAHRLSSVRLMVALGASPDAAAAEQRRLDASRLSTWLDGY